MTPFTKSAWEIDRQIELGRQWVRQAVAEERERCARIVEHYLDHYPCDGHTKNNIAALIRTTGEVPV